MKSFTISRRWYLRCFTCLVMVCTGALLAQEAAAKTALFVVGNTTLSTSDAAIKKRLDYYYTTTVRDDSASADTSKDVIVISASVDPAQVSTKYKAATKGLVVLQPALFDDMGMTAANAFGTLSSQTQIKINNSAHQMAAGFQSATVVTVQSAGRTMAWGTPSSNASLVALSADGNTAHATMFAYDVQRVMVNYTAPARRVGYYVSDASAYEAADRFILMRVPSGEILNQNKYEFFSGPASAPAWVSYSNRAQRTAIFTSKGRCLRNGMTYNTARKRYYWWQQIPPTKFDPDTRSFGGFGIYSATNPWGPWSPVYYTEKWVLETGASFRPNGWAHRASMQTVTCT